MRVVICGGGVIGAATAFFLARRGASPLIVERRGVACAASGKSGGFLALDWCDGTPLEALARRSFALHAELAALPGADWHYRSLDTFGGSLAFGIPGRGRRLDWVSDDVTVDRRLGAPSTTAQVHPGLFTRGLMAAAQRSGATLRNGEITNLVRDGTDDRVTGVEVDGELIAAEAVVIAMGPWANRLRLPLPTVYGLKGHSLVFETGTAIPPQALFLECREADGAATSPEVFPRADGTTYVCAIHSETPLPADPADVAADPGAFERLEAICARMSPVLARSKVLARQACVRPVTRDGLPLVGAVPGLANVFVATGHSVWGILNAPATGEAVAALILDDNANAVDLSPFDPGRFDLSAAQPVRRLRQ